MVVELVLLVVTVVTITVIVVSMIVDSVAVVIITRMIIFVGPGGTFWHWASLIAHDFSEFMACVCS